MKKKGRKEFDVSDIESQNGKTIRRKERKNRKEKKKNGKRDKGTTSPQQRPKHKKPAGVSRTVPDTPQ